MAWKPDYVTLVELKSYVRVDDSVDDAQLAMAIPAASRAVDRCTHRQFGKVAAPEERFYPVEYSSRTCRWRAPIDDLQTTAGLVAPNTDYRLEPRNALAEGKPYTHITFGTDPRNDDGELALTAAWGWTTTPITIKFATSLQASRFAARRDSPYGVAGSPQQGSELRLLARVDPDVAVSLKDFTREWWAA
jgi:hypothetical protein